MPGVHTSVTVCRKISIMSAGACNSLILLASVGATQKCGTFAGAHVCITKAPERRSVQDERVSKKALSSPSRDISNAHTTAKPLARRHCSSFVMNIRARTACSPQVNHGLSLSLNSCADTCIRTQLRHVQHNTNAHQACSPSVDHVTTESR